MEGNLPTENVSDAGVTQKIFLIRVKINYHKRRQAFIENWSRLASGAAAVFGSATFTLFFKNIEVSWFISFAAVIVTILSTLQLVFGFDRFSRFHRDLADSYYKILITIISTQDADKGATIRTATKSVDIERELVDLERQEGYLKKNLYTLCWNDQVFQDSLTYGEQLDDVGVFQELAAHFFDLPRLEPWSAICRLALRIKRMVRNALSRWRGSAPRLRS